MAERPLSTLERYRSGLFKVGLEHANTLDPTSMEMVAAELIDKYVSEMEELENKLSILDVDAINQALPGVGLTLRTKPRTAEPNSLPHVVCFISHEEHQLRPFLEHLPFVVVCKLTTGDVAIVKNSKVTFLLERKTTRDMIASVKTNRFSKQRERLAAIYKHAPGTRVGLLMEGDEKRDPIVNKADFQILTSSIHNAMYTESMHVISTTGLLGTVLWIVAQIRAHLIHSAGAHRTAMPVPDKCPSLLKTPSNCTVGPGTFLSRSAGCATNMSAFRAIGLLAKWDSVRDLCHWTEQHGVETARDVIASLPFLSENQLRRKRSHDMMMSRSECQKPTKIGRRCAVSLLQSLGFVLKQE
jgi:hypothetical protein